MNFSYFGNFKKAARTEAQSKKPRKTVSSKDGLSLSQNERKAEIESNSKKMFELERQMKDLEGKIKDLKQRNVELSTICDQNDCDFIDSLMQ